MKNGSTVFQERIYDLVCGNVTMGETSMPERDLVQSEFVEGSDCANAYSRMLEAYSRICARLGVEEWADADVEIIINELMGIGKHISLRMFDYGVLFGRRENL